MSVRGGNQAAASGEVAGFDLVAPAGEVAGFALLQPLDGVRWPAPAAPPTIRDGQVAMFDVVDPGKLQEWGRRG